MARGNGKAPPDPLDELDEVIAELEGNDWQEVTENHIHVELPKGTTLEADRTGRLKAISMPDTEITKPDIPRPSSEPPKSSIAGAAVAVIRSVNNPYALGALALLVVALWVWLTHR